MILQVCSLDQQCWRPLRICYTCKFLTSSLPVPNLPEKLWWGPARCGLTSTSGKSGNHSEFENHCPGVVLQLCHASESPGDLFEVYMSPSYRDFPSLVNYCLTVFVFIITTVTVRHLIVTIKQGCLFLCLLSVSPTRL